MEKNVSKTQPMERTEQKSNLVKVKVDLLVFVILQSAELTHQLRHTTRQRSAVLSRDEIPNERHAAILENFASHTSPP